MLVIGLLMSKTVVISQPLLVATQSPRNLKDDPPSPNTSEDDVTLEASSTFTSLVKKLPFVSWPKSGWRLKRSRGRRDAPREVDPSTATK